MTEPAAGAPAASSPGPVPVAGPGGQAVAFGVLAVVGAAVFASSFGYGLLGEEGRVGPGLLPMVTGLLLLLLSAGQLLARLRRLRAAESGPGTEESGTEEASTDESGTDEAGTDVFGRTGAQRVRQLGMVVLAMPVAVLLVPLLGFLAAFGLLVLFVCAVVEQRPPLVALLVTALAVACGYGVFAVFLDVPLPTGLAGDLMGW
jgi:putative tricarboxylic transport membrane protein